MNRADAIHPSPQRCRPSPCAPVRLTITACVIALLSGTPAWAEKADREQPMVLESDQGGTVDLQKQIAVYQGNVVIQQGSLRIGADRVEVRQDKDSFRQATAWGNPAKLATLFQRLDTPGETLEGEALRLEHDGRTDTLKLMGNAKLRRLKKGQLADEVTGAVITWQNGTEVFKVEGSSPSTTNSGSPGRVRAIIAPRDAGSKP
jgi:lipopolysaccharide export system protein LptA